MYDTFSNHTVNLSLRHMHQGGQPSSLDFITGGAFVFLCTCSSLLDDDDDGNDDEAGEDDTHGGNKICPCKCSL